MGVDLGDLAVKRTISLDTLSGKVIAIDAFNTIYQFLASIRQEDGTPLMDFKGRITAHLSGLFYRTARLIENGIRPVFVFDGVAPAFKKRTREARARTKFEAEEKWRKALEEERFEDARRHAQATSRLTGEMIEECKELLVAMDIPYVQAPSEGEAQASVMVRRGVAYAAASQDYDSILFGSPRLVRNISITGRRRVARQDKFVLIEPEEIVAEETRTALGVSQEQLIIMGILIGTDFNIGVPKVGPKTALKVVKEHKTLAGVQEYVKTKYNYEFEENIGEVLEFFTNPPYAEVTENFSWGRVSSEKIERILVHEHDFSAERVASTVGRMVTYYREKGGQSKLDDWF